MKNIIIVAGPSAVGKTTVMDTVLKEHPARFEFIRSVTTRAPRGDAFDSEYIYVSHEEFDSLIKNGGVLEYTEYAGNRYGTPRSELDRICAAGKTPFLILDIDGVVTVTSMKNSDISACAVYIYDDFNTVDARLYERYLSGTPTVEGLEKYVKRKEQNIRDYLRMKELHQSFYAFLHNDTPDACAQELMKIFTAFVSGEEKDIAANSAVVESLAASVENYKE